LVGGGWVVVMVGLVGGVGGWVDGLGVASFGGGVGWVGVGGWGGGVFCVGCWGGGWCVLGQLGCVGAGRRRGKTQSR